MGVSRTHERVEKSVPLLIVLIIVAISFGTLVELLPLIFSKKLAEPVAGLEPYSALELGDVTSTFARAATPVIRR